MQWLCSPFGLFHYNLGSGEFQNPWLVGTPTALDLLKVWRLLKASPLICTWSLWSRELAWKLEFNKYFGQWLLSYEKTRFISSYVWSNHNQFKKLDAYISQRTISCLCTLRNWIKGTALVYIKVLLLLSIPLKTLPWVP